MVRRYCFTFLCICVHFFYFSHGAPQVSENSPGPSEWTGRPHLQQLSLCGRVRDAEVGSAWFEPFIPNSVQRTITITARNVFVVLPASKTEAARLRQMINDSQAFPAGHYTPSFALEEEGVASQVMIMGPDDFIVSVMRY